MIMTQFQTMRVRNGVCVLVLFTSNATIYRLDFEPVPIVWYFLVFHSIPQQGTWWVRNIYDFSPILIYANIRAKIKNQQQQIYDKHDDFTIPKVKFPLTTNMMTSLFQKSSSHWTVLSSNIPVASAPEVIISQLMHYLGTFLARAQLLTQKLLKQGYIVDVIATNILPSWSRADWLTVMKNPFLKWEQIFPRHVYFSFLDHRQDFYPTWQRLIHRLSCGQSWLCLWILDW